MKLTGILLLLLLVAPAAPFAQTSATPRVATVRGLLENTTGKDAKPVPAPGFLVTIENKTYTSPAVNSGKNGLYYIPNVAPGNYTLKVWADPKNPLSFPITIKAPLTDIPPVIVPPGTAAKANPPAPNSKPKAGAQPKQAPLTQNAKQPAQPK